LCVLSLQIIKKTGFNIFNYPLQITVKILAELQITSFDITINH